MTARIQVVGGLRLERDGKETPPPAGRKARALFGYLVLYAGAPRPREHLAGLFWADSDERRARQSLRQALSEIRKSLDALGGYAVLDAGDLLVTLRLDCPSDIGDFLRWSAAVASGPLSGTLTPDVREALEQAALIDAGAFLPECADDWCIEERERLKQQQLRVHHALLGDARTGTDQSRIQHASRALLTVDPLDEDAHRALMEALARSGDRAGALRQYQTCVALLERDLAVEPAGETDALYERIRDGVLGAAPDSRDQAAPLTGRDRELAAVMAFVQEARSVTETAGQPAGSAAAVAARRTLALISGAPGIGKTRLLAEIAAQSRFAGLLVVEADAGGSGRPRPYQGWDEVLRQLLLALPELAAALPPAAVIAISVLLPEARQLAALAGSTPDRARLFAGVLAVLRAAAQQRPLLLIFDDLHWAGADTLSLIAHVTEQVRPVPIALVAAARDTQEDIGPDFAEIAGRLQWSGLALDVTPRPLSRTDVAALLRHYSGNAAVATDLADEAFMETEGNPLHLGELWRMMQERGRIEQDAAGRWRWRGGPAGGRRRLPLPLRVRALITDRIGALSASSREAITLGAVLGAAWTAEHLELLTATPADVWTAPLAAAVEKGLLRQSAAGYQFAHDVIRETVERELDQAAARALHLRAGEALERAAGALLKQTDAAAASDLLPARQSPGASLPLPPDVGAAGLAAELARHFTLAGPRGVGRAFRYTYLAAQRARDLFAHARAIEQFRLALDYAEGGLLSDPRDLATLRFELADTLGRAGRLSEAEEVAASAFAAFAEAGDHEGGATARAALASLLDPNLNAQAVIRLTSEALQLLGEEDSVRYASLLLRGAYAMERLGHADELLRAAASLEAIAKRTDNPEIALIARHADTLWRSNYSLDQVTCAQLRLQLAEEYAARGDPFMLAELLGDAGDSLVRVGQARAARPLLERAVAEARRLDSPRSLLLTVPPLMELWVNTGDFAAVDAAWDELHPLLAEALSSGRILAVVGAKGVADMWRGQPTPDLTALGRHNDPVVWQEAEFVGRIWSALQAGQNDHARDLLHQIAPFVPAQGEGMRWLVNALMMMYNHNILGLGEEAAIWLPCMLRHGDFQIPGAQARLAVARTLILLGRPEEATPVLAAAVEHCRSEGLLPLLAEAHLHQAEAAQLTGRTTAARPLLDQAEALFSELGMTPSVARVRLLRRQL